MTDSVSISAEDLADVFNNYLTVRQSALADAHSDIGLITTASEYEEISRIIGDLRLKMLITDMSALTTTEWDTVKLKAILCTLIDGPGVLEARGLLPLIDDVIIIDASQCIPLEERSSGNVSPGTNITSPRLIEVIPNPAINGWNVVRKDQKVLAYILYTVNGAVIRTGSLDQITTWISAGDLTTGLYFLHISDNFGGTQIEKLQLLAK